MLNERNIQLAVDNRLSSLAASEERRMRILRAANQERREAKPVRSKKWIVAIALMALLLTSAIAVAETLNLFDFFGKEDARYANLAPKATLEISEPMLVAHPHLGEVEVKIDSAYFDGLALSMTYQIDNSIYVEEYTPTAEEIARMQLDEPVILAIVGNEPYAEVHEAYNAAVESGTPFGYRQYSIGVHDHTYTGDGIDIEPHSAWSEYKGNALCEIMDFRVPLDEPLRSRDALTVTKKVYQQETTVWFDGKDCYIRYAMQDIGTITATIPKDKNAVQTFTGSGRINGVACTFTAEVSPLAAVLTLETAIPLVEAFPINAPEGTDHFDQWREMALTDQQGRGFRAQTGMQYIDETHASVTFDGLGELPESLTAYAYSMWESAEWPELSTMEGVALTK